MEIKILRRVRAESSRRPPRHRRDACSMAWRCRFVSARRSRHGRVIAEKRLNEELSVHPTLLISTQVLRTAPQFKRATLIVIAHRIKTIVDSDQILVLDRGRLVEDGSPSELISQNGAFAEMVRASRSRSATNLVAAATVV